MGLVPTFTKGDITRYLNRKRRAIRRAIINTLAYLGEECVTQARNLNTYRDQTGNLRNSIGYVIVADGKIVRKSFRKSARLRTVNEAGKNVRDFGSADGKLIGELFAEDLARAYPTGYALIVVAGMNYAAQVESRGLDVLTSAETYAKQNLPGLLRRLQQQVEQIGVSRPDK